MNSLDVRHGGLLTLAVLVASGVAMNLPSRAEESFEDLGSAAERRSNVDDDHPSRIVSTSPVIDGLLLELCEPSRIAAVTTYSQSAGFASHRFAGFPGLASLDDVEAVAALRPDLVLVSNVSDIRRVERLRDAGLRVADVGAPAGIEALYRTLERVGAAVGEEERAATLQNFLRAREQSWTPRLHGGRALFVARFGGNYFGGGIGSSQHDVLVGAGFIDIAAEARIEGYPSYPLERIIALSPEWLLTEAGAERRLCESLQSTPACQTGQVLGISQEMLGDAGLGIFDAADDLYRKFLERQDSE